ncbi:hypothetical protein [Arthrobacter sp. NicSoilB8]|uniref:hypothetical protein n=1 Tax=Arthrobacter sp. NicSoilB8 TaxID=2830998 RepID=UPI001CC3F32B|nr:hypothetical protein [Arthrobacter sp. NicSoilB8]BCW69794.1 hypothetical protein NicSoilB8_08380 [Arthrobacter sp. NicSoilB8]
MQQSSVSPSYAAAELRAREHWSSHDFREAAIAAQAAADIAGDEGDSSSWWHMTFFRAESLLAAGDFEACAQVAGALLDEPGDGNLQLQAQVRILKAKARHGLGMLDEVADEARAAADLTKDEGDVEINVKARQALIAALADSGKLEEAWAESLIMAEVISGEVDDQLVGKAYWVIGNVAFLSNNVHDGLYYHDLAAATFSPARNLTVWAKFNNASAAMRLAADVADADALRCIERAELATDVIGGSDEDHILLKLNRGHWNYLAGDPRQAIEILSGIFPAPESTSPQILGEACLLLGRSHAALGIGAEARKHLLDAADHFEKAGAPQRAEQALEFLTDVS